MPRSFQIFIAVLACAAVAALSAPPKADSAPTRMEKRLVARINDARASYGMRRLRIGSRLQRGAHSWSLYLRRADSFFHARLSSGTAENIAWATCRSATPRAIVRMWLASSGHRVHLLDRSARYVGAGWAGGAWRGYNCVEMAVSRFR
jgi:uncharacterized protein YkwD